jgi:hypothetical protein
VGTIEAALYSEKDSIREANRLCDVYGEPLSFVVVDLRKL